jgi:hypothetical protein
MPWDTFMKDEAVTAAAVGGGSQSTSPADVKDEAAIAAALGDAHAGDQAVIAATIRGMALNRQLAALNRQHETHTQFARWPSRSSRHRGSNPPDHPSSSGRPGPPGRSHVRFPGVGMPPPGS